MSDKNLVASSLWSGESEEARVFHFSDLPARDRVARHGSASLHLPEHVTAGDSVDVHSSFTIGETALGPGSALRIGWRWPFDWAGLQQSDTARQNYLSVSAPQGVVLETQFEHRGNLNPWHHDIDIRVQSGKLVSGDQVEVTCTGWDAPTFSTEESYFLMLINPDGGKDWIRLVDPPRFRIRAGEPDRLVAIGPADGYIGEQATIRIRAIDAWENATPIAAPELDCPGAEFGEARLNKLYPVWEIPITWKSAGVHRIGASHRDLSCESNPTRVTETVPKRRLYWGDLHAGQSEIGCGAGSLDNHYTYARDVAALQFASQQANDHYITKKLWEHVRAITPRYNEDGKFLAYLGCEWSPYTEDGGDRNVLYMNDEARMRRSDRFFMEHEPDPEQDLRQAPEFLEAFRNEDVLLNLHVGGRPTNLDWHEPAIEPLFEVHSTHATSEWFLFEALGRGYKVGVTAGTDGVMGRPGACGSGRRVTRNVRNGLTAVRATSLTQRAVADGFFARECYGTTGARMLMAVTINGHPVGSEVTVKGDVEIHVAIEGTSGIERIDLFRGTDCIESKLLALPDPHRLRLLVGGAKEIGTAAAQRQLWAGTLKADGGNFRAVTPVGFQSPLDRLSVTESEIGYDLGTAGNDLGFTFATDGEDVSLELGSPDGTIKATAQTLRDAPQSVDCGGVERRIELGAAPAKDTPQSVSISFTDANPNPGEHPYWIRVVQTDRHRAWSSPIYVTS